MLSVFASPYATQLTGHSNSVNAVALSPGGRTLATASDDRTARLWDVTDLHHPKDLAVLLGHTDRIFGGSHAPVVKSWRSAAILLMPPVVAVSR